MAKSPRRACDKDGKLTTNNNFKENYRFYKFCSWLKALVEQVIQTICIIFIGGQ